MIKKPKRAKDWRRQVNFDYEHAKRMLFETGSVMPTFFLHMRPTRPGETEEAVRRGMLAGPAPSEAEDRCEIVVVSTEWIDDAGERHVLQRMGEIERNAKGKPSALVEDRLEGISLTGRFLDLVPPVRPDTEQREWARRILPKLAERLGLGLLHIS